VRRNVLQRVGHGLAQSDTHTVVGRFSLPLPGQYRQSTGT
jgi:hypothetical protein